MDWQTTLLVAQGFSRWHHLKQWWASLSSADKAAVVALSIFLLGGAKPMIGWLCKAPERKRERVKKHILEILRAKSAVAGGSGLREDEIVKLSKYSEAKTLEGLQGLADESEPRIHVWNSRWFLGPPPKDIYLK